MVNKLTAALSHIKIYLKIHSLEFKKFPHLPRVKAAVN